jgi:hypothetical protein
MYHPKSCYSSRRIDYSAKLNEILAQGNELSDKILIMDDNTDYNHDSMSKSLGMYDKNKCSCIVFLLNLFIIICFCII